ncbi:hypothetical protein Mal15_25410 [Stieleria maiorica]|uniref:Uncharacterized protein n=1 Tax=Stieleria maiorica TaxID=2795974 RepID=A0A5B9MD97_9BACT|nr:hypothetical protein [Stieleria maiorica]QEF98489.1 hypothetical protein Mal15_25410 [Stieleria maiorica]
MKRICLRHSVAQDLMISSLIVASAVVLMALSTLPLSADERAESSENPPQNAVETKPVHGEADTSDGPIEPPRSVDLLDAEIDVTDLPRPPRQSTSLEGPAALIRGLSDGQLAALARGEQPNAALAKQLELTGADLHQLLLDELAERLSREHQKTPEPLVKPAAKVDSDGQSQNPSPPNPDLDPGIDRQDLLDQGPVEVRLQEVVVQAQQGTPAGAVVIELVYAEGQGPILFPDQPLFLVEKQARAKYVTFDIRYQQSSKRSPFEVDRILAAFLVNGQEPLDVTLMTRDEVLLERVDVKLVGQVAALAPLKSRWWKSFSKIPDELGDEQKLFRRSLAAMLARRYAVASPWPVPHDDDGQQGSGLEAQFERAVGMLFGMESVKLAMQEDVTLNESTRTEIADQPVPPKPRLASVAIPAFQDIAIEPMAMHVPEECFYLRTGSLDNYKNLRQFLTGWGGDLSDVVNSGSLDRRTRDKIEFQLALAPAHTASGTFDQLISDMALVGCDPLFSDGAAVGVAFEAVDSFQLADEIKRQRRQMLDRFPEVSERRLNVANHRVSLLSTDDNRVRSFYAIDGKYHLVTNSQSLLNRFFQAGRGDRSLGKLREFRYARRKADAAGHQFAFLYLSDPFFQNLVSPHYRIELTRRSRAAQELQQFRLAKLLAKSEGIDTASIDELVKAKLLPRGFGDRADGSRPIQMDDRFQDSLRGVPGAFLPIPDVPIDKATRSEVIAYRGFVRDYNREWRRVDPVTVVFTEKENSAPGMRRIGIEIVITPYARQKYALLERHLADPGRRRFAADDRDLLSVDTAVRMRRGSPAHLLYIGLRDDQVAFEMNNGQVRLLDQEQDATFAKLRSFGVISPPSTDILRMLASVLLNGQPLPEHTTPRSPPPPPRSLMPWSTAALPFGSPPAGQLFYYFAWGIANLPPGGASAAKYLKMIESRGDLTTVAMQPDLRDEVFHGISRENIANPPKVRLRMRSLSGADIEPYIQAYTYLASRQTSYQNARFLADLTDWLNLPTQESQGVIESLLNAKIACPLGGAFQLKQVAGRTDCVGTAWNESSLYQLHQTPETWKFPFLDWLREMDLRFDLDQNTLHAKVDLTIRADPLGVDQVKVASQ